MPSVASNPTINDLRALASMLPPSERVFAGEVSDVLSAVVNVVAHGPGLLDAAQNGMQAVYDFFHNVQVEKARALGVDEPQKGAPVYSDPNAGRPATVAQPSPIDYNQLAQAIIRAQAAEHAAQQATSGEGLI